MNRRYKDHTGKRFGRLLVLELSEITDKSIVKWKCLCDCGTVKILRVGLLTGGDAISCGCYNLQRSTTHGDSKKRLYIIWRNMQYRCFIKTNQDFENYGGRGITVCDRWRRYENFREDMGASYKPGLSLDRISTNGNYEPGNCKWSTVLEQNRNKRNNRILDSPWGEIIISVAAEKSGISKSTILYRLNAGKSMEEIFKEIMI